MYNSHFGFRDFPFRLGSDPNGLYFNRGFRNAYNLLLRGIHSDVPLLVLTGQAGTGKTALVRKISTDLDRRYEVVFSRRRYSGFEQLVEDFCREMRLDCLGKTLLQNIHLLSSRLIEERAKARHIIFVFDATEEFSPDVIVNLILLTRVPKSSGSLFQVLLIGLPSLDQAFEESHLGQFRNDTHYWLRLLNLDTEEVGKYVEFRIRSVGCQKDNPFTPGALERIAYYSGGNPGIINRFCSSALLGTFLDDRSTVSAEIIDDVAAQCILSPSSSCDPNNRRSNSRKAYVKRVGSIGSGMARCRAAADHRFARIPEQGPDHLSTRYEELGIPKPGKALVPVHSPVAHGPDWYSRLARVFADNVRLAGHFLFFSMTAVVVLTVLFLDTGHAPNSFAPSLNRFRHPEDHYRGVSLISPAESDQGHVVRRDKIGLQQDQIRPHERTSPGESKSNFRTSMDDKAIESIQELEAADRKQEKALQLAEMQIRRKRLTTPPGDNAFETYQALLAADPGNIEARYGLFRIKRLYQRWGLAAERRGNLLKAREYYIRALRVAPDDTVLSSALQHVNKKIFVKLKYDS